MNTPAAQNLPLQIITMVLNGEPFIRHHIDEFARLSVPWRWHIVEGVAALRHDTAWSLRNGGRIPDEFHQQGRSNDGTSEYLDELAKRFPQNVTIYRKTPGHAWDGKIEMLATPLVNIPTECILWRIDADELWTTEQLERGYRLFLDNPARTAAAYWCHFFVGPKRVTASHGGYGNNPLSQWIRTWRFRPGMRWGSCDPPLLAEPAGQNQWRNIAAVNPFLHQETQAAGLVFQHFSLATEAQCRFKEAYYGFRRLPNIWKSLQAVEDLPGRLGDYFPWVGDATTFDRTDRIPLEPMIELPEPDKSFWPPKSPDAPTPRIVIDGVFFQFNASGIARLWKSLLEQWTGTDFARHLVVLDRAGTAPKIPGIRYRPVPLYYQERLDWDRQMLQATCDDEQADLFISTYYTIPLTTPAAMIVYDMIVEILNLDLRETMALGKPLALNYVKHFLAISQSTRDDLIRLHPHIRKEQVAVTYCGINPRFAQATPEQIAAFKTKFGITRPYYLFVGLRDKYKNARALLAAYNLLPDRANFQIVCTGSHTQLEPDLQSLISAPDDLRLTGQVQDDELVAAYSGAVALVFPSKYEGFGLPVAEAMACACPVITTRCASLPEVGGDAPIYIPEDDYPAIAQAMIQVRDESVRQPMIEKGLQQAKKFTWQSMADHVRENLLRAASEKIS